MEEQYRWTRASTAPPQEPRCLACAPSGRLFAGSRRGLFYSEDNASTWRPAALDGVVNTVRLFGTEIWAGTMDGLFRSADGIGPWRPVPIPLPEHYSQVGVSALARSPGGAIWAGICDGEDGTYDDPSSYEFHAVRSTDDGASWQSRTMVGHDVVDFAFLDDLTFLVSQEGVTTLDPAGGPHRSPSVVGLSLLVHGDTIFAGGGDLHYSVDRGQTWNQWRSGYKIVRSSSTFWSQADHFHDLVLDGDQVIAGTGDGVFVFRLEDKPRRLHPLHEGLEERSPHDHRMPRALCIALGPDRTIWTHFEAVGLMRAAPRAV